MGGERGRRCRGLLAYGCRRTWPSGYGAITFTGESTCVANCRIGKLGQHDGKDNGFGHGYQISTVLRCDDRTSPITDLSRLLEWVVPTLQVQRVSLGIITLPKVEAGHDLTFGAFLPPSSSRYCGRVPLTHHQHGLWHAYVDNTLQLSSPVHPARKKFVLKYMGVESTREGAMRTLQSHGAQLQVRVPAIIFLNTQYLCEYSLSVD